MSSEPRWLEADEVIELNRRIVADTGEDHIVKDRGLLESALVRPRHLLALSADEPDALEMAVSICIGISRNHPFIQGNKRTAFAAMEIFLYHAGYELRVPDKVEIADFQVAVIERDRSEEDFLLLLDEHLHERPIGVPVTLSLPPDPFGHIAPDKMAKPFGGVSISNMTLALGYGVSNRFGDIAAEKKAGMIRSPIAEFRPGRDIFGISKKDDDPDDEKA